MSEDEFQARMRQIGLDPNDHDVDALRAAYQRLNDLFHHLETDKSRMKAQALPVFDPGKPL